MQPFLSFAKGLMGTWFLTLLKSFLIVNVFSLFFVIILSRICKEKTKKNVIKYYYYYKFYNIIIIVIIIKYYYHFYYHSYCYCK